MESVVRPTVDPGLVSTLVEGSPARTGISIIVPCWREDAVSVEAVERWLGNGLVGEVLIAAAGAEPDSVGRFSSRARVVRCPRLGRGTQMNEAARHASGEILLFHHADTELTEAHLRNLSAAMHDPRVGGGAFQRQFDERHPRLRWLEPWEARRCRRFGPVFGDQSIFVRRSVFEAMGGFADVPLMEDVEFSCRLRRRAGLTILAPSIRSSARKHLQQGRWHTTLTNTFLLGLYVLGVSPQRLHGWYYRPRR